MLITFAFTTNLYASYEAFFISIMHFSSNIKPFFLNLFLFQPFALKKVNLFPTFEQNFDTFESLIFTLQP